MIRHLARSARRPTGVLLADPAVLRVALERLPGAAGQALRRRLGILARTFAGAAPAAGVREHLTTVLERLAEPDPEEAWLALAVLTGALPTVPDVQRLVRTVRLEGPVAGLRPLLLGGRARNILAQRDWPDVEVVSGVVVDVQHTSRTELATGIQRVARNTVRFWNAAYDIELVGWSDGLRSLRRLHLDEVHQTLTGERGRDKTAAATGTVLIPWQGTYLLPELAPERERTTRIMALAHFARCTTGIIGFDCVPISSAETTDAGVSEAFAGKLAAVRHMDRVAAISEAAAEEYRGWRDMLAAVGLPGPEIEALRLPVEAQEPDEEDLAAAQERFVVGDLPLLLCVGTHEPRKNHLAVLHAAETAWRAGHRFSLTFVGGHSWNSDRFDAALAGLQAAGRPVESQSKVDDRTLWAAYRVARGVLFPSLNEGYGLPVAEALALGTPVITSNFGSMAEIAAGGGAILVDPRDDASLARAIGSLVSDEGLLARLRGEAQSRPVATWEEYAKRTWDFLTAAPRRRP